MDWIESIRSFVETAETGSFSTAAKRLNIANSVHTKRIQWLEKKLACHLFYRTTRKVVLTEAGEFLLIKFRPLLNEWLDVYQQAVDYNSQPQGNIKIAFPPNIAHLSLFSKVINKTLRSFPKLSFNIITVDKPVYLLDENIDILIATEKYIVEPSTIVGIKLFDFQYKCIASPTYIANRGEINKPEDLEKHNCLIYHQDNKWLFSSTLYSVKGNLIADSGDTLLSACVQGLGLAYFPNFMIQDLISNNIIETILPKYSTKSDKLMIYYKKHEYKPRKISLLIEAFKQMKYEFFK